jgi:hypothetical protein
MKQHLFPLIIALFLIACGGSAGNGSDKVHYSTCDIPDYITVTNTSGILKQVQFKGGKSVAEFTGDDATRAVFSCPYSGVQNLSFELDTENFFNTVGDHIAVLNNAEFDNSIPYYLARGIIIHKEWGILGERFYRDGNGGVMVLQCPTATGSCAGNTIPTQSFVHPISHELLDRDWFKVNMVSDAYKTTYSLSSSSGHRVADTWGESDTVIPMTGKHIVFALLCNYSACNEQQTNYTVHIRNIHAVVGKPE